MAFSESGNFRSPKVSVSSGVYFLLDEGPPLPCMVFVTKLVISTKVEANYLTKVDRVEGLSCAIP